MRRSAAVMLLSAFVPALLVVPTLGRSAADPHPVTPELATIALTGVDASAWAAEQATPAPADPDVTHTGSAHPSVFTAQLRTAPYSLVGVTWDSEQPVPAVASDLDITVRTRSGGEWQPWVELHTDSGDGPAEGEGVVPVEGSEGQGRPARVGSSPYFAGPSDGVQVRVDALTGVTPVGLRVDLVNPGESEADSRLVASVPSAAQAAAGAPSVISRGQWGADESLRNAGPTYEPTVKVAFVHHTATSNSYTKGQAAAAVRSIYAYDTNSLGWSDIAYNVIVDKFGQVFEGRYGGLDRTVRSGATGGFNAKSWAVSALGNYVDSAPTSAMLDSIEDILAWKLGISHLDPRGKATLTAANGAGTTAKYRDGTKVAFDVISGHRDAGSTACPGAKLYAKLGEIRSGVVARMGAQLYATSASPKLVAKGETTPIRVRATAMTAQDWRLEVKKQGTANVVRTYQGSASAGGPIDVSWNLKDSSGDKVAKGIYTLTLQSWNGSEAAVPYGVNVGLFGDGNVYERPANGIFRLQGRGYGHGHGMSQFGAEGAARKGLTRDQILSFYYPGTKKVTAPPNTKMRVQLTAGVRRNSSVTDVRLRSVAGLTVSDGGSKTVLPPKLNGKTVTTWRTKLSGAGNLGLFGRAGKSYIKLPGWGGRTGPFRFTNANGAPTTGRVTLVRPSGQEVVYRGTIEVRRNGAHNDLNAISVVLLDDYVKSVVSAEMPGGWTTTAYEAQSVAARSYAMFKRAAAEAGGFAWHICDSTSCQVYNGYTGETSPESKAATATAGQYLTYAGAPIFAEFSSANGGWSSDGGKPYLIAQEDPYDGVVKGSANWGHAWTKSVSAATIQARYPALGSLQRIVVTDRVGEGAWGGRVVSVRLEGSKGNVNVSGTALRSALGLKSEWFRGEQVPPAPPPVTVPTDPPAPSDATPSKVRGVTIQARDRAAAVSWEAPKDPGTKKISGYRLKVSPGGRVLSLPAAARSATIDRLVNGRDYTVTVQAKSKIGTSKAVSSTVKPTSAFGYQVDVAPKTVFSGVVTAKSGQKVRVLGVGGLPATGVAAVTLRVTATSERAKSAWLKTFKAGDPAPSVAQQTVPPGGTSTNLLLVKPGDGAVRLEVSRTVDVSVDVLGYQTRKGAVGRRLVAVTPTWLASGPVSGSVPLTVQAAGAAGVVRGVPEVLVQATVSAGPTSTTVRVSPDGSILRAVPVATVPAGETVTVPVMARLAPNGSFRVLANGIGAYVSLDLHGYYVKDDGVSGSGRVRAVTPTRVYTSQGIDLQDVKPLGKSTLTIPVLGRGGVPATGVSAVILNVIAVDGARSGSLVVFPAGAPRPSTRALSFDGRTTVRTTVIVKVGAAGSVQVFLPSSDAHVLVDVAGYVTR